MYLHKAERMLDEVQLEKNKFISNWRGKHGHKGTVTKISYSNNSKFIVTIGPSDARVWKINGTMAAMQTIIPLDLVQAEETLR
jgi:hypothetical protein